jgi:hypothetical protein
MAEYAWHGTAFESPFCTLDSSYRVSIICDIQWNAYNNTHDVVFEGVRIENKSGRHMYYPNEFVESELETSLDDLAEWIRPKFEEHKLEIVEGAEYNRSEDLINRDHK